jgi:all-trans-retinol dehydrogenase (NAD+)
MKDLSGKRVLITGAARGIGLEMAIRFAEQGSEIVLTDLREDALPAATETVAVLGVPVRTYALDVTDRDAAASVRERIHAEAGPIDVLVNNAGVVFGGPFADVDWSKHELTYRVNVLGVAAMTHVFLPDLVERPEAHLVNIASASGFIGLPYGVTYASSKWAVIGFSESVRAELELVGHDHVHVSTICPSYIGTGMFEGARSPTGTAILEPVKLTPPLKALLPTKLFDLLGSALGVTTSMSGWTGHDEPSRKPAPTGKGED